MTDNEKEAALPGLPLFLCLGPESNRHGIEVPRDFTRSSKVSLWRGLYLSARGGPGAVRRIIVGTHLLVSTPFAEPQFCPLRLGSGLPYPILRLNLGFPEFTQFITFMSP